MRKAEELPVRNGRLRRGDAGSTDDVGASTGRENSTNMQTSPEFEAEAFARSPDRITLLKLAINRSAAEATAAAFTELVMDDKWSGPMTLCEGWTNRMTDEKCSEAIFEEIQCLTGENLRLAEENQRLNVARGGNVARPEAEETKAAELVPNGAAMQKATTQTEVAMQKAADQTLESAGNARMEDRTRALLPYPIDAELAAAAAAGAQTLPTQQQQQLQLQGVGALGARSLRPRG